MSAHPFLSAAGSIALLALETTESFGEEHRLVRERPRRHARGGKHRIIESCDEQALVMCHRAEPVLQSSLEALTASRRRSTVLRVSTVSELESSTSSSHSRCVSSANRLELSAATSSERWTGGSGRIMRPVDGSGLARMWKDGDEKRTRTLQRVHLHPQLA